MITKKQAFKRLHAIEAIRKKTDYDPNKPYKWSIMLKPNDFKEFIIYRYSSVVSDIGFISRHDAEEFMKDPDNMQLLKDAYQ